MYLMFCAILSMDLTDFQTLYLIIQNSLFILVTKSLLTDLTEFM